MDTFALIHRKRAESQIYTYKYIRVKPEYILNQGVIKSLHTFIDIIDSKITNNQWNDAKIVFEYYDDFYKKEFLYWLISEGRYEDADILMPVNSQNPQLIHLKTHIKYRLGESFDNLIICIKHNIKKYKKLLRKENKAQIMWAIDLQFWGVLLALKGKHQEALRKYDDSFKIYQLPETLFNKFCCYNRTSNESQALNTLKVLETKFDLRKHQSLVDKLNYDVACDRFRKKQWFADFLLRNNITAEGTSL